MKKSIGLLMIVMAVISMAFVSCDANTAPQTDTLGEIYLSNESRSRGINVTGNNTHKVESLYWYYKAEKNDTGLFNTGVTNGFVPVKTNEEGSAAAGLGEANLGLFSYGNWTFTFYGVKTAISGVTGASPAETIDSGLIVYSGSQTIEVNKDRNFLDLTLNEGAGLTTEIKFDTTEGVWFGHDNITTGMSFSLAVVDKVNGVEQGTINAGTASVEDNKVSFKGITYEAPETGIAEGQHVMTFTLTQTGYTGTTTNIAKVATYELAYTVSKGMTYTVKGDLTSAEVQGEVSVGSYAVSVPETTASKVIPVKSADSKVVKTETTVSTLDLTVKYPEGAVLDTTTETAVSGSSVTADATIGFKLNPNVEGGISVVDQNQELTKYELVLNVAQTNTTLVEVSKFIGKNLEIEAVYHSSALVPLYSEELASGAEYYMYTPSDGILKLYVKHASPIDVVTKKVLAVASIGAEEFTTLQAAIEAAMDGDVITILRDVTDAQGIAVGNGVDFTIDFGGHTYTLNKPGAGSKGTETSGFQLKKTSTKTPTITFKNGTINISEENLIPVTTGKNIMRIIQNYSNLNLIDMNIDGTNQYGGTRLVMSFNNGTVNISGNTNITAAKDSVAFDSDGNWGGYDRCIVNIDTTGTIVGNIEVGQGYLNLKNANVDGGIVLCKQCGPGETTGQKERINVTGGSFDIDPSEYVADEYKVKQDENGLYNVVSRIIEASNFTEFQNALNASEEGDIIKLTSTINPTTNFTFDKSVTVDMNGYGFVRATEASGGYSIKLIPGCNLVMKNGSWDMAGTFGNIAAEGKDGECTVIYENVTFTNLDNPTKEELVAMPGNSSNLVKTAFKANMQGGLTVNASFIDCTFTNANVEFGGFNSDNTFKASFTNCVFNNIGNTFAIKADNYGMSENCEVTVSDCTFNIVVTSNVSVFDTRNYGNQVKLTLNNNEINGTVADSDYYKVFSSTSLKAFSTSAKFNVVNNNTKLEGIATLN